VNRAGAAALIAAAAVLPAACVYGEATTIGPHRASRPPGCPVELYPSTAPPFAFETVATARADCDAFVGRSACIEELRRQACRVGAEAVIGFSESVSGSTTHIAATLAVRTAAAPPGPGGPAGPAPAATPPASECEPICSPGFACQAGKCIPQCNPPCEAGEVCTRKRICEAAPHP